MTMDLSARDVSRLNSLKMQLTLRAAKGNQILITVRSESMFFSDKDKLKIAVVDKYDTTDVSLYTENTKVIQYAKEIQKEHKFLEE